MNAIYIRRDGSMSIKRPMAHKDGKIMHRVRFAKVPSLRFIASPDAPVNVTIEEEDFIYRGTIHENHLYEEI